MAKVAHVNAGNRFEKDGIQPTRQKSFRIVRDTPGEYINFESLCKVRIGSRDAENPWLRCVSYTAEPEGEGRMVWLVTFTYTWTPASPDSENDDGSPYDPPGETPQLDDNGVETSFPEPQDGTSSTQAPDVRPANWHIQSSLIESPAYSWRELGQETWTAPKNPAGDLYEGVTRLEPVVSIHVQQFMWPDPTANAMHVGKVNKEQWTLGQMVMPRRSVMLRAMNTQPHNELFNDKVFRGWMATYEFLYRPNYVPLGIGAGGQNIGWDWAQPQSGFNVKAFNPNNIAAGREVYGQPLRHASGRIPIPLSLPEGVQAGDKVRAMVRIAELEGGVTQLPSAQPIALNDDGTPRIDTDGVIVKAYQIYDELDFDDLDIRLQ
jgi:hypothetical protein